MSGTSAWIWAACAGLSVSVIVACAEGGGTTAAHSFTGEPTADGAAGDDGTGCSSCTTDDATSTPPG